MGFFPFKSVKSAQNGSSYFGPDRVAAHVELTLNNGSSVGRAHAGTSLYLQVLVQFCLLSPRTVVSIDRALPQEWEFPSHCCSVLQLQYMHMLVLFV